MKEYVINPNTTVYLGNSNQWIRDRPDESIDAIITDPPYGISYKTNMRVISGGDDMTRKLDNDSSFTVLKRFFPQAYRVLKPDSAICAFCRIDTHHQFVTLIEKAGFKVKNTIIWYKNNFTVGDLESALGFQYECIIYAMKGKNLLRGKREGDVWEFARVPHTSMIHPTQKPVPLLAKLIQKFTDPGATILDPFGGSFSTGVACAQTNRKFIGIEIDEERFKKSLANIRTESDTLI